jgi:hypothetical protein
MGWRRFTQGHIGALSARQYSEVQDAVQALVSERGGLTPRQSRAPYPMLVRIKGIYAESRVGEPSTVDGAEVIDATSYLFEQVHVRLSRGPGTVEIAARPYGTRSRQQEGQDEDYTLVAIDPRRNSNIAEGTLATVIPLAVDAGEAGSEMPSQQGLYLISRIMAPPQAGIYQITAQHGDLGRYFGLPVSAPGDQSSEDPVEIVNLYETNDYYGALDTANGNPCVQLAARALGIGDTVFALEVEGVLYTMAPIAFRPECQSCTPGSGIAAMQADRATELAVAGIMMR